MATVTELRNEWAEAVTAAGKLGDDKDAFDKAWSDAETKRGKFENAQKIAEAEKSLSTPQNQVPTSAETRNPKDADWVKEVTPAQANLNPAAYKQLGGGVIVPYATKDTEGYVKRLPVSVQHPSILARLSPEMREEKSLQEDAFAAYFRRGENWILKNRPELAPHLKALNALQEDNDSEGGYLVPIDQRFDVIRNPLQPGGNLRPRSTVFTTSRDGGTFPTATSVTWTGIPEETSNADVDPAFGQVPFTIHKSGANNRLSMELLSDSAVNIPALLGVLYGAALGRYEDQQGIEGDGSTEPGGLRTTLSPQGAISTKALTATTPTAADLIAQYFNLPVQWRNNGSFFLTSSLMARFWAIGAAAAGIHFIPDDTSLAANGPAMAILGRPVFMYDGTGWDDAAVISANEVVGAFGDFSQYYFVDRMAMVVARSDDVYFATDQVAFKARVRYDSFYALADAFRLIIGG